MCKEWLGQSSFRPHRGHMKSPYDHGPPTDYRHADQQRDMLAHRHCIKPGVSQAERKKQSRCSDCTDVRIFHNGQTRLNSPPPCQTVHHIGQTVLVEPTGEDDEQEHQYDARDLGRKNPPQEQICRDQYRSKKTADKGVPTHGGSQLIRFGIVRRSTEWNRREELPGEQKRSQHHGHVLRSDTPASSNVAISVKILIAANTRLMPRQAPVPSPSRRSRSNSGFSPRCSSIA